MKNIVIPMNQLGGVTIHIVVEGFDGDNYIMDSKNISPRMWDFIYNREDIVRETMRLSEHELLNDLNDKGIFEDSDLKEKEAKILLEA